MFVIGAVDVHLGPAVTPIAAQVVRQLLLEEIRFLSSDRFALAGKKLQNIPWHPRLPQDFADDTRNAGRLLGGFQDR